MANRFGLGRIAVGIGVVAAKGLTGSDTLYPEHPFELGRVELALAGAVLGEAEPPAHHRPMQGRDVAADEPCCLRQIQHWHALPPFLPRDAAHALSRRPGATAGTIRSRSRGNWRARGSPQLYQFQPACQTCGAGPSGGEETAGVAHRATT